MRIIVTGAAGFIGSNLAFRLLHEGHEVIGIDNFITGTKCNIDRLLMNKKFSFFENDVINPIKNIAGDIDWIMHFASPASPPKYIRYPMETLRVNSEGTLHLLELCRRKNAFFFLASTSEIYGDPEVHPQPETYWGKVNPNGPRSVYDEAKRYSEAQTLAYHRYYELPVRIIRIFNTYGPNMDLMDGRVVTNLLIQAIEGKPLTIYGNGTQTRSFQYIDDLIEGIRRLMEVDYCLPVNLGNPKEFTILELAQIIRELLQCESKIQFLPLPQDDPLQRKPDITLAKNLLDWEPKISLYEGLSKMIRWIKKEQLNS